MRTLFISCTYPDDFRVSKHGIFQRMRLFLTALNKISSIDILFYVPPGSDTSCHRAAHVEAEILENWGFRASVLLCLDSSAPPDLIKIMSFSERAREWGVVHSFYYRASGAKNIEVLKTCLQRNPTFILVHKLHSILPVLSVGPSCPVFLDLDDVEHIAFIRNLGQPPIRYINFLHFLKLPSLIFLERMALMAAKKTFVCSERDSKHLSKLFSHSNLAVIPNAIEMPQLKVTAILPIYLFLGTYRYGPNTRAAQILIEDIWPIIKSEIQGAKLIVAGAHPENIKCFSGFHHDVEFRGFVEDLDRLYEEARVVCCPIQSGSGTRIKILEAAAYGKAIVSTTVGAEGLEFSEGSEILLEDDIISFAKACIFLGKDWGTCKKIGEAAHKKARALYSKDKALERILNEVSAL